MKDKKIEISLEEYKELLEIKGRYEELKSKPNYIYVYKDYPIQTPSITKPNITWATNTELL